MRFGIFLHIKPFFVGENVLFDEENENEQFHSKDISDIVNCITFTDSFFYILL